MATATPARTTHISSWRQIAAVLLIVAAVAAAQIFARRSNSLLQPGQQRGDVQFQEADLPAELAGWKRSGFTPGGPVDQLPDGQRWWSHSWTYSRGSLTCVISIDQADFTAWHELSGCYCSAGWQLESRNVTAVPDHAKEEWDRVEARLSRASGDSGTVLFSLFSDEGRAVPSPEFGLRTKAAGQESFTELLTQRLNPDSQRFGRVLQCQLFATSPKPLPPDELSLLHPLFDASRERLRTLWLDRNRTLMSANQTATRPATSQR
jgi:hypothetical protein